MSKLLITTALEETWGLHDDLYFLGEWCRLNNQKKILYNRTFSIQPYHFGDREKFAKDHDYLSDLYEHILTQLTIYLNNYHKLEYPISFWRIIIGPWLLTWISILWDRWESIRIAMDKNGFDSTIILKVNYENMIPYDYDEFTHFFQQDIWNHWVYSEIINFRDYNNCIMKEPVVSKPTRLLKQKSYKMKIAKAIDKILGFIPINEKVLFSNSYFSLPSLIKVSLKLKQIPRLHLEFQDKRLKNTQPWDELRKSNISFSPNNEFETFVRGILLKGVPLAYLEGFNDLRTKAKHIKTKAKIIFTANSHFGSEIFKLWCAERQLNEEKLIISDHGGSIRPKYSMFNHQESIAGIVTKWTKPYYVNHIQLPATKDYEINNNKFVSNILLVGLDFPRYSYRFQSGPCSSLLLNDFNQKVDFIKKLKSSVYNNLKIRVYPTKSGWDTYSRYIDNFGIEKISTSKSINSDIANSKLVICTYPQTTFSEAMNSGVPTILLFTEEYWEFESIFDPLVKKLKEAKIIFSEPKQAAIHINEIFDNPYEWWEKEETKIAKKYFHEMCGEIIPDGINKWVSFFKNQINMVYAPTHE